MAGANTTHYVYGAGGLLYGEYDNAGDLIREYIYLNDAPLTQVDAGAPETVIYLHPDHLGTPRFATNTGGTQVWAWAGDAFGVGAPSGSATINIRMPGQYVDAESGLFYNWNRYYNPSIGRYISSDPIGLEGGLNTFLYAEASPVMYADPEGLIAPAAIVWLARAGYTAIRGAQVARAVVTAEAAAPLTATTARVGNALRTRAAVASSGAGGAVAAPQAPRVCPAASSKPTPNFIQPTNPPQLPPETVPPGMTLRIMRPTAQYPNGYWRIEKPMQQGGSQGINPTTMRPGRLEETHIELPPGYWK